MKIKFLKVRNVITPQRAHEHDAGIDFFLPQLDDEMIISLHDKNDGKRVVVKPVAPGKPYLRINPGQRVLIPTGIKAILPNKNSAFIAFNKSGLASKKGIIVTAQVVDADYTGEIHVGLLNTSMYQVNFFSGDKIGQFVYVPIYLPEMEQINEEEFLRLTEGSDRGEGGFGSTDNK